MSDPLVFPTTLTFGGLVVEIETATPGAYAAPCGFDTKAFNKTGATSEANVPPCNAPDAPGFAVRGVSSLSIEVTGAGVMAVEDIPMWTAWWLSGQPKNVRVVRTGTDYWQGPAVLTTYNEATARSQNGNLVQLSIALQSAGPWTNTTGAPAS